MHFRRATLFIIAILSFFVASCVSVQLNKNKISKSTTMKYSVPESGFEERSSADADLIWTRKETGASISVYSECSEKSDPSLQSLAQGLYRSVENPKILTSTSGRIAQRQSLEVLFSGEIDGIETSIRAAIYKKSGCFYILSLVSKSPQKESDIQVFEKFVGGFSSL